MRIRLCSLAAALALAAPAAGAPSAGSRQPARGPSPPWVTPVEADNPPPGAPADDRAGERNVLDDRQINVGEESRYEHRATQLLTPGAVEEGSRLSVSFDPSYEALTLHRLTVCRDGRTLDRLAGQEIKLLERESRLDYQVYDGRLSAVLILEDIRVGDTVEYAYTVHGRNPIFGGRYADEFYTRWSDPVMHQRLRVLFPANRPLARKAFGETQTPQVATLPGGVTEWVWDWRNVPALISDRDLPSWYDPWAYLQFSEFGSWAAVVPWALGIYAIPPSVPPELETALREIARLPNEEDRVLAALRYVQDNIRYLGLEVGENTQRPYPIATVLARRFGDCKDKATLLCAALRRLGFEAYPALVDTDRRGTVADSLPSPLLFNHMVVQLRLRGVEYWLDPTDRDQGGSLAQLSFPDYGKGLVIAPGATGLATVRPGGQGATAQEVHDSFDFQDFSGDATFRVRTIYRGGEADGMRRTFAGSSLEAIGKKYLNYYARVYPQIVAVELPRMRDDRAQNTLSVDELYHLAGFWKAGATEPERLTGVFAARLLRDLVEPPATSVRTMPIGLDHPRKIDYTVEVNLPWQARLKPENLQVENPALKFSYTLRSAGEKLSLHFLYQTLQPSVAAAEAPRYLADLHRMRDVFTYELLIPKGWAVAARPNPSPAAAPAPARIAARTKQDPLTGGWNTALGLGLGALLVGATIYVRSRHRAAELAPGPVEEPPTLHRCTVCGATERSDPTREFRVARDGLDYCTRHLPGRV